MYSYAGAKPTKAGNTRGISRTASFHLNAVGYRIPAGLGAKERKDLHARRSLPDGERAICCRLSLIIQV